MISDVPGYTWGIVPALAQAGVKYFSIGPNGGERLGRTIVAWQDKPFYWIAPDGSTRCSVGAHRGYPRSPRNASWPDTCHRAGGRFDRRVTPMTSPISAGTSAATTGHPTPRSPTW